MRTYVCALTILFSVLSGTPRAYAQGVHTASSAVLDAAVQGHVDARDADRQTVQRLLDRSDVKAVAAGAGIELRSVSAAITTLDAATLAQLAAQSRAADQALAGGQSTVTISTTAIIIGLLILILIVAA